MWATHSNNRIPLLILMGLIMSATLPTVRGTPIDNISYSDIIVSTNNPVHHGSTTENTLEQNARANTVTDTSVSIPDTIHQNPSPDYLQGSPSSSDTSIQGNNVEQQTVQTKVIQNMLPSEGDQEKCPSVRPRSSWGALPPKTTEPMVFSPVPFVVLHHTYQPAFCNTSAKCEEAMRSMQRFHQLDRGWNDIGYSYVIGGDGLIYEGRTWDRVGAHSPRYNDKSVGISFIGDFRTSLPTPAMLSAAKSLISCGVNLGKIRTNYVLLGHRQVRDTECPGGALYEEIRTWPHYSEDTPSSPANFESFLAAKSHTNHTIQ